MIRWATESASVKGELVPLSDVPGTRAAYTCMMAVPASRAMERKGSSRMCVYVRSADPHATAAHGCVRVWSCRQTNLATACSHHSALPAARSRIARLGVGVVVPDTSAGPQLREEFWL